MTTHGCQILRKIRKVIGVHLTPAVLVAALATASSVEASKSGSLVCDAAAAVASDAYGVPLVVMRAITRTETGRSRNGKLDPWPWTVNMEGDGKWFDNRIDAQIYVDGHFDRGARSFDVGCFQINYRWHGQAFSSIEAMFDPIQNANYAARFLQKLHAELGSWEQAVGAYHSRTPKYANRYIARYRTIIARLDDGQPERVQTVSDEPTQNQNSYPLLVKKAQPSRLGSLVPLGRGTSKLLPSVGG